MLRLTCPRCGLSYAAATLPHYLAASAGASCPHCGTPLAKSPEDIELVLGAAGAPGPRRRLASARTLRWAEKARAQTAGS
jgi:hypothetical protein